MSLAYILIWVIHMKVTLLIGFTQRCRKRVQKFVLNIHSAVSWQYTVPRECYDRLKSPCYL